MAHLKPIEIITTIASVAATVGFILSVIFGQPTINDKIIFSVGVITAIIITFYLLYKHIKALSYELADTQKELIANRETTNQQLEEAVANVTTAKGQELYKLRSAYDEKLAMAYEELTLREEKIITQQAYTSYMCANGHRINHRLRDSIFEITQSQASFANELSTAKTYDDIKLISERYVEASEKVLCNYSMCATTSIIENLKHYDGIRNINEEYRIFVELVNPDKSKEIRDWEVVNAIMDSKTWELYGSIIQKGPLSNITVSQNAGFEALAVDHQDYYIDNNLSSYNKHGKPVQIYRNVKEFEPSNAICMVPIRYYSSNNDISTHFYGFLVVDSVNRSRAKALFTGTRDAITLNILSQEADAIACICIAIESTERYLNKIKDNQLKALNAGRRKTDQKQM